MTTEAFKLSSHANLTIQFCNTVRNPRERERERERERDRERERGREREREGGKKLQFVKVSLTSCFVSKGLE